MSRKRILWPGLIGIAVVLGSLLLVVGHSKKAERSGWNESTPQLPRSGPAQNIRFIVYGAGIYPRQLRAGAGIVGISIEDRTAISLGLLVEQYNGTVRVPIGQINRVGDQLRGRERFRLAPGRYRISNLSRPTSEAELIVDP